jgi:hypothetical protein
MVSSVIASTLLIVKETTLNFYLFFKIYNIEQLITKTVSQLLMDSFKNQSEKRKDNNQLLRC